MKKRLAFVACPRGGGGVLGAPPADGYLVTLYARVLLQEILERAQPLARPPEGRPRRQLHVRDEQTLLARREERDGQKPHESESARESKEREQQHGQPVPQTPAQHRGVEPQEQPVRLATGTPPAPVLGNLARVFI